MKRLIIVLLFPIISFFSPSSTFAQTPIPTSITIQTTIPDTGSTSPSLWTQFWNWLFGLFIKTDYEIDSRPISNINSDMNDYGDIGSSDFDKKHSFAGSRLTDINNQNCLKGNVIKNVILKKSGYPDSELAYICLDSTNNCTVSTDSGCQLIKVSDLAHYLVQLNKPFYCDYINNTNQLMKIESNIITKVQELGLSNITEDQKSCYQKIYDDFYITPKDNSDDTEENAKKIIQTPISAGSQDSSKNNVETGRQVDANFIPEGANDDLNGVKWDGLNSLRPASSDTNGW